MENFLQENWSRNVILPMLIISLLGNAYFLLNMRSSDLEKDAFCAQFKEQAADRIRTYYTNGDVISMYPDEIFFSKKENSCIALWSNIETNENGIFTLKVIFDAITNKDLFSATQYFFNEGSIGLKPDETNAFNEEQYNKMLHELRAQ